MNLDIFDQGSNIGAAGPDWLTSPFTAWGLLVLAGLLGTLLAMLAYDRIRARKSVRVRRMKKSSDRDVEAMVELYERLFAEECRVDSAEVVSWLDEDRALRKTKTHTCLHFFFVGKVNDKVVCMLKAIYSTEWKFLFIAYYGIDTTENLARRRCAPDMLKALGRLVTKELRGCRAIVFEVQAPDQRLSEKQNAERKARIRLFRETARRLGINIFKVDVDYLQPQMVVAANGKYSEESMALMYAPLNATPIAQGNLSRAAIMEILRFVYLEIYRPIFRHDAAKDFAYQSYLNSLLNLYEADLPDSCALT
ncbi:MAG: hypothetical protein WEB52_14055 [Dehalococcoidia bacterium]